MRRLVLGCMTGTSLDGIDAAAVEIEGFGLEMRATIVDSCHSPLGELAPRLRNLAEGSAMTAAEIAQLSHDYSVAIARTVGSLKAKSATLASVHGQTIYHSPPLSWQLLSPGVIASALGCPVISDLRAADLAAGGQGAPITPLADAVLYGDPDLPRRIINLGGFVNVTDLPSAPTTHIDSIRGGDVCPCNQALDLIARRGFDAMFDEGGRNALSAVADGSLIRALVEASPAARTPRSLGTHDGWNAEINRAFDRGVEPCVIARSVCSAIARCIAGFARFRGNSIVLAGGGARNKALVHEIERETGADVVLSDMLGVAIEDRESAAMAVLGALSLDGIPITLEAITGCRSPAPIAGTLTLHGKRFGS